MELRVSAMLGTLSDCATWHLVPPLHACAFIMSKYPEGQRNVVPDSIVWYKKQVEAVSVCLPAVSDDSTGPVNEVLCMD